MPLLRPAAVAAGAAALAGLVPGVVLPAAQAEGCDNSQAAYAFTDDANDATRVIEDTFVYSDPALDIRSASVTWDETAQEVLFEIEVEDLRDLPALGSHGEYFDFNFNAAGTSYYVTMEWDRTDPASPTFLLGRLESLRTTLKRGLAGAFDVENDRIWARVPAAAFSDAGVNVFQLHDGDVLEAFEVVSRRQVGAVVPDADDARGECGITVAGVEAVDSGLPELDEIGDLHSVDGLVTGAFGECVDCFDEVFLVETPAAGATLRVSLSGVTGATDTDLDLALFGPNGTFVTTEEIGSGDVLTFDLPADGSRNGRYEVEVTPYTAVEATFTVNIELV